MASSSLQKRDGGRLHLRLPPKLKRELERFAKRNHTTVTATVLQAVVEKMRKEASGIP